MAVLLSPVGGAAAQFLDNNGNPLLAGKLYTYVAGTTTNQATYTSSSGVTPHTNPIILDAGGRVPGGEMWLTDGLQYKFVLKNANDVLIGTYDNLVGINSNFVNFLTETEVQTATAGQTVFTLTTMQYQPGTNNLTVYVDGVNQIDGATYSYVETSSTVVTFTTGLHVGALVKFTTAQTLSTGVTDASLVTYQPPFTSSVATTVENKLAQYVSVIDFGAVGDGVIDDTFAIQAALSSGKGGVYFPEGKYRVTAQLTVPSDVLLFGAGKRKSIIAADMPALSMYLVYGLATNNITFRDLSLWGNLTENAGVNKAFAVAYLSGCTNVLFDNCEFSTCTTHTLTITRNFSTSWIQGGNPNSQSSVDALVATLSTTIRVVGCSFRYAGSNHFAAFGVNGLWVENCDFSNDVDFYDILADDASTGTLIDEYAVNLNINVLCNIGSHSIFLTNTSTAYIAGNTNDTVLYSSYDFNQQLSNLTVPFFALNYLKRGIQIVNNNLAKVYSKSYGYVTAKNNVLQSSAAGQTLVTLEGNSILWGSGVTYYDSIATTAVDTQFVNSVVENNIVTAAHATITGISGSDFYRVTRDNIFSTRNGVSFTATDLVGAAAQAAQSMLFNTDNLKLKRKSRYINEILDSGVATLTVASGARSATASISFNYSGTGLNTAPVVLVSIQNGNNVLSAGENPASATVFDVATSTASISVWLAANAGADRILNVAWVVVNQ